MKIFTYICALILGALLISAHLYYRESNHNYIAAANSSTIDKTLTPNPSDSHPDSKEPDKVTGDTLQVRGTSITLGENVESLVEKLGPPSRIVDTEYAFDYYVYNNDYRRLLFVALREGKIIGYYTDAEEFSFLGIASGAQLNIINQVLDMNYSMQEVLTYDTKKYTAKILMDTVGTEAVTGIYVLKNEVEEEYTPSVSKNIELLIYDLVNSIRARNDLPLLSYSSSAAKAARKHSLDMALNGYFDHITPLGKTPGDRLREEGLNYNHIGENIIAGYGTAILSNHAWYNSPDHRKNLLDPEFTCIGIGFAYQKDSNYKTYITQNYYR